MRYIKLKKIDFMIIFLLIVAAVLLADNWYFGDGVFNFGDIHHESFVIATIFGAGLLLIFRNKLW